MILLRENMNHELTMGNEHAHSEIPYSEFLTNRWDFINWGETY